MRKKIIKKLSSQQGITILLSLLLFLICTVAGSVLITAGTAASGTISERAKLDQRYFSVMSAAELLRDKFDGKSVRVTTSDDSNVPTSISVKRGENWITSGAKPEEKLVIIRSLFLLQSLGLVNISEEDINRIGIDHELAASYDLKAHNDDGDISDLQIKITIKPEPEENLKSDRFIFTLENANGDDKIFRVKMDYSASLLEETDHYAYTVSWQMGKISVVAD